MDMSRIALPPSVPRDELGEDVRAAWDRMFASEAELRSTWIRAAGLEERRERCAREECARQACLNQLSTETQARQLALRKELQALEDDLGRRLEAAVAAGPTAGALLARGSILERIARRDEVDDAELARRMAPAIASYEAASARSDVTSPSGWFARYLLAHAHRDGRPERGRQEFTALVAAPYRAGGTAEAAFRVGELEEDPARAADSFKMAAWIATRSEGDRPVRVAALFRLTRAELGLGRFRAAVVDAAQLLELGQDEEGAGLVAEAEEDLSYALGLLGARDPTLPRIAPGSYARVGALVARHALTRFDVDAAAHAWRTLLVAAPGSLEAQRGRAELAEYQARPRTLPAKDELSHRVRALGRSCGALAFGSRSGGEIELRIEARTEGRARIVARPRSGDKLLRRASACLEQRGPGYFVGAPASASGVLAIELQ